MSSIAMLTTSTHEALNNHYLAGYFDGKAAIYVSAGNYNSSPQLRLQIRSIAPPVADFIIQTYRAGRLTERNTKFVVSSQDELWRLLSAVHGYLLVKKPLVTAALALLQAQSELEDMRNGRVVGQYDKVLETEIRLAKRAMYDLVDNIQHINKASK